MRLYLEPPSMSTIRNETMKELVTQLNIGANSAFNDINIKAISLTKKILTNGDFANQFIGGELRGSFGIRPKEVKSRLRLIIDTVANDTYIFYKPFKLSGYGMIGGWTLAIGTNLSERVKNHPSSITMPEATKHNPTPKPLPWMKWILERGNAVIITDFRVKFKLGKGRSGYAHMIPNAIIGYRVPPLVAGTDYDNWITRDITPHLQDYADLILRMMNKHAP